jgi:hypothetical protein
VGLLGVISTNPLRVRVRPANGAGWVCLVQDDAQTWTLMAHRGGGGSVAVHRSAPNDWTSFSSERPTTAGEKRAEGNVIVGCVSEPGAKPYGMEGSPWAFVYEGTITDPGALRAALDPTWIAYGPLETAGDFLFVHLLKCLALVGPHVSSDLAMIRATYGLRAAQALGVFAFVCSDGASLYAYASGRRLTLARLGETILVGSPELVPTRGTVETVRSGELVSLWREPLRRWSVLVTPDP